MPASEPLHVPRRRLLRGAAGLAAGGAALPTVAAGRDPALSVMSRNLYVGVDLSPLFHVEDVGELRSAAGDLLADIERHPYAARADAMAAEIDETDPGVVCVQEAALVRTRDPSRFDGEHDPAAEDVLVDLLDLLTTRLEARGLTYEVAESVVTNDVEVPADTDGGTVDLRLTNRVAVLVRGDLDVARTGSGLFDAGVPVPLEGVDLTIGRGYATADVVVEGRPATVVSTHLESFVAGIRDAQARELREVVPDARPVVVGGDFNVGPETSPETYLQLRESFADAYAALRPDSTGPTCCHANDLDNETPTLTRRVDGVLHDAGRATAVERVGASPADRVTARVAGETVRVWPSDHAGVVATVTVPPTPTATGTARDPTPTRSPTSSGTASGRPGTARDDPEPQDGFGVTAAVTAAVGAVLAALRLRPGDDE